MLKVTTGVSLAVLGLALVIYLLDIGKIRPIPGAQFIQSVLLCGSEACIADTPQPLPYFSPRQFKTDIETLHFHVSVPHTASEAGQMALYFPKFSDRLKVVVNGQTVFSSPASERLWNTPLLIPLLGEFLQTQKVEIKLVLTGMSSEGLDLQPFYLGPASVLVSYQDWRSFFGPVLARFALGLMIVLTATLLTIWTFRRSEREYLWLGLACVVVTPTLLHYGYTTPLLPHRVWTLLWILCPSLYALLILQFLRSFLGIDRRFVEHAHAIALAVACIVVLFSPPGYAFALSMWGNLLINVPSTFSTLAVFWLNRAALKPIDLKVFLGCFTTALVLGVYALYLHLALAPTRTMHLFHLLPLVMSLAFIWLILSRLIRSLREYEVLTTSLNDIVTQKTGELEASFAELADIKKREAIADERDRIMLDLHDGIGGQLVGTLAYMQSNDVGDTKIRRALEDALRDLALMLDSMGNHDSLVTLLGMLRTRLEGLLSEHGVVFDWQVHGEPVLTQSGPSQSLHLARIVQEAITNVIKHANADTITVFVDETQIKISDNGTGFDLEAQTKCDHPSHGIVNMKRRSAAIGATFYLTSDARGTQVQLRLV